MSSPTCPSSDRIYPRSWSPIPEESTNLDSDQRAGLARNGYVDLRGFDQGIVETLGAFILGDAYWLTIPSVDPPPGMPGTPVTFSFPEDIYKTEKIPFVLVRRDSIEPAMERWHPGAVTYSVPVYGDVPMSATLGSPPADSSRTLVGPRMREQQEQAVPYDITYTISVISHHRGGVSVRGAVNNLFQHVLRYYQPYCTVAVRDSVGALRSYSGFQTGTQVLDELPEVTGRVLGFGVTVRVEAELDQNDSYLVPTVTSQLTMRLVQK